MITSASHAYVLVDFVFKIDVRLGLRIKFDRVIVLIDIRRDRGLFKGSFIHLLAPAAPLGINIYDKLPGFSLILSLSLFPGEPLDLRIRRIDAAEANDQGDYGKNTYHIEVRQR